MLTSGPKPDESTAPVVSAPRNYWMLTRTATYSFWAALPLFLLYEVLISVVNQGALTQVRIGAELWLKQVLVNLGGTGLHMLALVVVLIGVGILYYERKKDIPLRLPYFGWMILESVGYAIVLGFAVGITVGTLFNMMVPQAVEHGFWTQFALSLGAGLYEELFFRVLLVGGLFWLLNRLMKNRTRAYIISALVGALLFSWVHYIGSLGDTFTFSSFTFRFLFGLALNALYLIRGFGVAAWTHALYDVLIAIGFWS